MFKRVQLLILILVIMTLSAASAQSPSKGDPKEVHALIETEPVAKDGDVADDSAIWIHPTDPAQSTIIATDKKDGLVVYNLDGSIHQVIKDVPMNNVDLRYNFPLNGNRVALVIATDRERVTLAIFQVNPDTREIEDVAAEDLPVDINDAYGFCMYHSPITGSYYAILNSKDGTFQQYELFDNGAGRVAVNLVRTFSVDSQPEGCVADDELGFLYVGEEDVAIWKFEAEPDGSNEPIAQVDSTDDSGYLTQDVEGLTIYYTSDQQGYLIASSQGSDEYTVYDRTGDNAYLGMFIIAGTDAIDRASDTDGIDVTNFPLNETFPEGLFIAQDNDNTRPDGNQNFKLVSWTDIALALGLTTDTSFDPRTIGAQ